jgi:acetyl esterase/lipase
MTAGHRQSNQFKVNAAGSTVLVLISFTMGAMGCSGSGPSDKNSLPSSSEGSKSVNVGASSRTTVPLQNYAFISGMAADDTGLSYDLGNVKAGGEVVYNLYVAQAGAYLITLNASNSDSIAAANILVNGKQVGVAYLGITGSYATYTNALGVSADLPAGPATLEIKAQTTGFNLGGVALEPVPTASTASMALREAASVPGSNFEYGEYLPDGYNQRSDWPLLVFFHGSGECIGNAPLERSVLRHGPFKHLENSKIAAPMVVLAPQTSCDLSENAVAPAENFLRYALAHYKVSPNQLYIAGISLGAGTVVDLLNTYPDQFAAAIPVSPNHILKSSGIAHALIENGVGIWAAVASNDKTVGPLPAIRIIENMFRAEGLPAGESLLGNYPQSLATAYFVAPDHYAWALGQTYENNVDKINPRYLLTYYPTGGHSDVVWDGMYGDPRIYSWLLSYKK